MSRIYDALKKAEDESLANQAPEAVVTTVTGSQFRPKLALGDPASGLAGFAVQTWAPDPKSLIFTGASEEVYSIEQFRSLRSRLYQLRAKQPLQSILVCSAVAAEGKTFVSANLAMALAKQQGRKILLIDADLRKPAQHTVFGAPLSPGLTDLLAGNASCSEVIQSGGIENLWLMPCGTPAQNASELLGNNRMGEVLEVLAPIFDWIVLDSSPVLPVSDAVTISRSCDGVLLVARAEVTSYDAVQRAQHEFREARLLGVVLNGTTERPKHSNYYYQYGSGKSATYGSAATQSSRRG